MFVLAFRLSSFRVFLSLTCFLIMLLTLHFRHDVETGVFVSSFLTSAHAFLHSQTFSSPFRHGRCLSLACFLNILLAFSSVMTLELTFSSLPC